MGKYCIVYITSSSKEEAEMIGEGLIKKRLAACIQISPPIKSLYEWKGELCGETEYQISVKTKNELYPLLEEYVKKNHSYEVPQIVSVDIVSGAAEYLDWIDTCCMENKPGPINESE